MIKDQISNGQMTEKPKKKIENWKGWIIKSRIPEIRKTNCRKSTNSLIIEKPNNEDSFREKKLSEFFQSIKKYDIVEG